MIFLLLFIAYRTITIVSPLNLDAALFLHLLGDGSVIGYWQRRMDMYRAFCLPTSFNEHCLSASRLSHIDHQSRQSRLPSFTFVRQGSVCHQRGQSWKRKMVRTHIIMVLRGSQPTVPSSRNQPLLPSFSPASFSRLVAPHSRAGRPLAPSRRAMSSSATNIRKLTTGAGRRLSLQNPAPSSRNHARSGRPCRRPL
ncbi:hypothetical protein GGR57DRAFT_478765 [Xylariaceae sp. FL1272]|nr:hypothetical protein GGR57DRAFT_478765 [Xylariaceae sp. FL1272]